MVPHRSFTVSLLCLLFLTSVLVVSGSGQEAGPEPEPAATEPSVLFTNAAHAYAEGQQKTADAAVRLAAIEYLEKDYYTQEYRILPLIVHGRI